MIDVNSQLELNNQSKIPAPGEFVSGTSPFQPDYDEFVRKYPGRGKLKVQISAAKGTFPVKDVVVDVAVIYNGIRYTIYNDLTNNSGIVDNLVLPARPCEYSQNPLTASAKDEATYYISVYHPDFLAVNNFAVAVYDAIETILPIALEPITREVKM